MLQAVVLSAELPENRLAEDMDVVSKEGDFASVRAALCIPLPVQVVAGKLRYPFSPERIALFIVAIASSLREAARLTAADRAGKQDVSSCCKVRPAF